MNYLDFPFSVEKDLAAAYVVMSDAIVMQVV